MPHRTNTAFRHDCVQILEEIILLTIAHFCVTAKDAQTLTPPRSGLGLGLGLLVAPRSTITTSTCSSNNNNNNSSSNCSCSPRTPTITTTTTNTLRVRNRGWAPSTAGGEISEPPLHRAPTSGTRALQMSSLERASFGRKRNFWQISTPPLGNLGARWTALTSRRK